MKQADGVLWTSRYVAVLVGTFLCYVGFQMLVPTLTTFLTENGSGDFIAGLSYSLAAGGAFAARGIFGSQLDRLGRKPLLIGGLIVISGANVLLWLPIGTLSVCILRLVQGLGWGVVSTAFATIATDVIPAERRGEGIGYFSLAIGLATSFSIILGIRLMDLYGFAVMLMASTAFFAVSLALFAGMPAVPFQRQMSGRKGGVVLLLQSLFEPRAIYPTFLCFLHSVGFVGIMTFIMLFGRERGIADVWVYFVGHLTVIVVSRPVVGRIFDRFGHRYLVVPGALATVIGLLIVSYARSPFELVIASLFYGLGFGILQPTLQAWVINRSPASRRGAANGTFLSAYDLGYAFGTLLMSAIVSHGGYALMYRASALLPALLLGIYGAGLIRNKGRD